MSRAQLTEHDLSVLSKGFNFAIAPARIPTEEIICGVEASITYLNKNEAETVRQEVTRVLRTARPPKKNLSTEERQALKSLRDNKNIIILPADKGNATVVMDVEEYNNKIQTLLRDPAYVQINSDPTTYLEKTTKTKIKNSKIDPEIQQQLIPREKSSRSPKFYGLPKIHKEDVPLRPIVSCIGSPLQQLAKYLAKQLQPHTDNMESNVKNASHFVELLKNQTVQPGDLLVSFDVVSLFTNIPVDEAIDVIRKKHQPPHHIMELTEHCLKNTYFVYKDQRYKQIEGAPMGSPLSPVLANLFMEDLEARAIGTAKHKPKLWLRYVDDTFVIWNHGRDKLQEFLKHLNGIHPKIQFTMETEEDDQLPFLDVLVKKHTDGTLGHTVYRKKTHTNRYLNAASHHHPAQLQSVIKTLTTRSQRLADDEHKKEEMGQLKKALTQNGFTSNNIRRALRPRKQKSEEETKPIATAHLPYVKGTTDKIGNILKKSNIKTVFTTDKKISATLPNPKTKIPLEGQGVYEIPCRDCSQSYIGQTNRRINVRRDEHANAVAKDERTSSLAQHVKATGHTIEFEKTKILANIEQKTKRIIREAIEIEKRPRNLNTRDDTQRLPAAWKPNIKPVPVRPTRETRPPAPAVTVTLDHTVNRPCTRSKINKDTAAITSISSKPVTRARTRSQQT